MIFKKSATILLLAVISCSKSNPRNPNTSISQLPVKKQQVSSENSPKNQERPLKCSNAFQDSLRDIISASNEFDHQEEQTRRVFFSRSGNNTETYNMKYHNFFQAIEINKKCISHKLTFSNEYECKGESNKDLSEEAKAVCTHRNNNLYSFNSLLNLYEDNEQNHDFKKYLEEKRRIMDKYNPLGHKRLTGVKKVSVEVISSDIGSVVDHNFDDFKFLDFYRSYKEFSQVKFIVDGREYNYFFNELYEDRIDPTIPGIDNFIFSREDLKALKNSTNYRLQEDYSAVMACDLEYDDPAFALWDNFKSFTSTKLIVSERTSHREQSPFLSSVGDNYIRIQSERNIFGNTKRSFRINCSASLPRYLTLENLNKTLEGYLKINILE